MTATMEREIYDRLGHVETKAEVLVSQHETILEKLEELKYAIHGNGNPGLVARVVSLEHWRIRLDGMKAGGWIVLSAVGACVGFIISGGLKLLLSLFQISGDHK